MQLGSVCLPSIPNLTLTKLYNVLERIRAVEAAERDGPLPLWAGALDAAFSLSSFHPLGVESIPQTGEQIGAVDGMDRRVDPRVQPEGGDDETAGVGSALSRANITSAASPHPAASQPPSPSGRGEVLPLSEAEQDIRDRGLVLIVKELHETIDRLVAEAYGWPADLTDEDILARLVALNKERAAEERRGVVRWLRPDYQIPKFGTPKEKAEQIEAELPEIAAAAKKPNLPASEVERIAAVFSMLAATSEPIDVSALAGRFKQGRRVEHQVEATLKALARMGHVASADAGRTFLLRRAG